MRRTQTTVSSGVFPGSQHQPRSDQKPGADARWAKTVERITSTSGQLKQVDVLVVCPQQSDSDSANAPSAEAKKEQTLARLRQLTTRYRRTTTRVGLAAVVATLFSSHIGGRRDEFVALGLPSGQSDDRWCVERGVLTAVVGKETYERLGIVGRRAGGQKERRKGDTYVVEILLYGPGAVEERSAKMRARLEAWDARRSGEGEGGWDVIYWYEGERTVEGMRALDALGAAEVCEVVPTERVQTEVYAPRSELVQRVASGVYSNGEDDGGEDVSGLVEWVGMACLGSQRLQASDRADPYIAVYEPPSPSVLADTIHVRWTGLLSAKFVQSVVGACVEEAAGDGIAAIVGHGLSAEKGRTTWTLLLASGQEETQADGGWVLAEHTQSA